jgi:hypothetical protein
MYNISDIYNMFEGPCGAFLSLGPALPVPPPDFAPPHLAYTPLLVFQWVPLCCSPSSGPLLERSLLLRQRLVSHFTQAYSKVTRIVEDILMVVAKAEEEADDLRYATWPQG